MENSYLSVIHDLPDLDFPEVPFNLQNFIDVSNQVPERTLLADMFAKESQILGYTAPVTTLPSVNSGFLSSKSVGFGSDYYGFEEGIQQNLVAGNKANFFDSQSTRGHTYAKLHELPDLALSSAAFRGGQREVSFKSEEKKSSKRLQDKTTDEYQQVWESSNIGVRMSQEKLRQHEIDTKRRIFDLVTEAGIKQKPTSGNETRNFSDSLSTIGYAYTKLHELPDLALNSSVLRGDQREVSFKSEEKNSCNKMLDKTSDEYRKRRQRINNAVRKCRDKLRQQMNDTERRICDLRSENYQLRRKVECLSRELRDLHRLLSSPEAAAKDID